MTGWIFQGNPKVFRVDEYLQRYKTITWTIRQKHFKDEISIGDEVYIWRSDGDQPRSGGIVAKGKIISFPQEMEDDTPDLWIEEQESSFMLRAKIEVEDVRLTEKKGMLKHVDLERDDNIKDMRILVFHHETNYKLEPKHAHHIRDLWEHKK